VWEVAQYSSYAMSEENQGEQRGERCVKEMEYEERWLIASFGAPGPSLRPGKRRRQRQRR
jgi:hypothetical protein